MIISKKYKKGLQELFNSDLSELNNKIISYKNDYFKIPYDKLKDFMTSELHLFIPTELTNNLTVLENNLRGYIQFAQSKKISWINYYKLLATIEMMNKNNIMDKVILLEDKNDNIFRLYIKILPSTSYHYNNIALTINISDNVITNYEKTINFNTNQDQIKTRLVTRAGIFECNYILDENKDTGQKDNNQIESSFSRDYKTKNNNDINDEVTTGCSSVTLIKDIDLIYLSTLE